MPSLGPVLCIESTEITEQFRGPQDRPLVLSSLGLVLSIESTEITKQLEVHRTVLFAVKLRTSPEHKG